MPILTQDARFNWTDHRCLVSAQALNSAIQPVLADLHNRSGIMRILPETRTDVFFGQHSLQK
jgi:hypothetical protein